MAAQMLAIGFKNWGFKKGKRHEARVQEKQEQIAIAWETIKQVLSAQRIPYSDDLAGELKALVGHYASYKLSGIQNIVVRKGDEKLEQQFQEDFESQQVRTLTRGEAEIDLFVDSLRSSFRHEEVKEKEIEQNFKILLSRNQAMIDFEIWIRELKSTNQSIALLFVDIDHFKRLNETYTHATVDRTLLPRFMSILKGIVKFRGEGYRYGGEEFLLILPNHDMEEAR